MQDVLGEWLVEAGWHVRAVLRRQGYAAEAAQAVRATVGSFGVEHLVAIIRPTAGPPRLWQARSGWSSSAKFTRMVDPRSSSEQTCTPREQPIGGYPMKAGCGQCPVVGEPAD